MARIIRFDRDGHGEAQLLLPWYVSGRLEAEELAMVERHLRDCAECRADVAAERDTRNAVSELALDAEASWAKLRRRIETPTRWARLRQGAAAAWGRLAGAGALGRAQVAGGRGSDWSWGWALAAQSLVVAAIIGLAVQQGARAPQADYHTLGSPAAAAAGDAIVVFRSNARAEDMAQALRVTGIRLVDGPTSTDAYVVRTPSPNGAAALERLRAQPVVALAEPLDSGGSR